MATIELGEAIEKLAPRIANLEQQEFELRQAVVHVGFYVLSSMIERGDLHRESVAASIAELANIAGKRCEEVGGKPRPNPALQNLAEGLRGPGPFQVIDGGLANDDGPDAA